MAYEFTESYKNISIVTAAQIECKKPWTCLISQ